jgi:hypothetical protein
MIEKKTLLRVVTSLCVTVAFAIAGAPAASAYDGNQAAAYADANAVSGNSAFPKFSGTDCANFVSQSVHAGGYGYQTTTSPVWYIRHVYLTGTQMIWEQSASWIRASSFYNFLVADVPGGNSRSTVGGGSTYPYTPNAIVTGDILAYDWGKGEGISHVAIQTGSGYDTSNHGVSNGWIGNYIDEHTNNRRHAFWSLKPYNVDWPTTTIYFQHISSAN